MRVSTRILPAVLAVVVGAGWSVVTTAQQHDSHTPGVSGLPHGVPFFCANPTVTSKSSGAWSDPATWSTGMPPAANDKVNIAAGHTITYDAVSDAALACIEVRGTLTFRTDKNTTLNVVTLMVLEDAVSRWGAGRHRLPRT